VANELKTFSVGPWKLGQNSVAQENAAVFQLPKPDALFPQEGIPQLTAAINVDIDNDGRISRRAGTSQFVSGSSGLSGFSTPDYLLYQDGTSLYKVNESTGDTTLLTSSLTGTKLEYHWLAGQTFMTDGTITARIDADGNYTNWGCSSAPTPSLSAVGGGSLRAGRYMVACTFVDGNGIEHSTSKAAVITITENQNISVTLSSVDSNASTIKVYITETNGTDLFYTTSVNANALPATVSNSEYSNEPLRTMEFYPPIPSDGLFDYNGMIMLFTDNYIFPSFGANHHLFEIGTTIEARPTNIKGGAGLRGGFWSVTEEGAYWTTGDIPENWDTEQRDNREYAKGSLIIPGYLIPIAETSEPCSLFVSEDGLMVGTSDGTLKPMTKDRLKLSVTDKTASIIYRENNDLNQVMFTLN
jgi:hypothetical protein